MLENDVSRNGLTKTYLAKDGYKISFSQLIISTLGVAGGYKKFELVLNITVSFFLPRPNTSGVELKEP